MGEAEAEEEDQVEVGCAGGREEQEA